MSGLGREQSGGFNMILGIALIILGALLINAKLQFISFEVDLSNGTFLLVAGIVAIIGGVMLLFQHSQQRLRLY